MTEAGIWATSQVARTENIESIFGDMKKGVCKGAEICFGEYPEEAFNQFSFGCDEDDCVLIAGKGHESFQEVQYTAIPFDDRIIAGDLLSAKLYGG